MSKVLKSTSFIAKLSSMVESKYLAFILYHSSLSIHGNKTIYHLPEKFKLLLQPIKDDLWLRRPGVNKIICERGLSYCI